MSNESTPLLSENTPLLTSSSSRNNTLEDGIEEAVVIDQVGLNWKSLTSEAKTLASLAFPVLASYVISFSIVLAPVFSMGHLSTTYLAASALTTMFCNVTGFSIGHGMASALDTLCSQAFTGSSDKFACGKHLQRGIIVVFLVSLPITTLWLFTEPLLLSLGQDPEIAAISGVFSRWLIPGLFPYLTYSCLSRYLQAQGIMTPTLYIMLLCSPINVFLQWFLVWSPYGIGPHGSALATSITNTCIPLFMILYIKFVRGGDRYGGWDWNEALDLKQLYTFIKLGVPGVLMLCSEWWAFEIVALIAGMLGEKVLAAQTIILNTCSLLYSIHLGVSVATTTRIGNSLGANLPNTARIVASTGFCLALSIAFMNCMILLSVKDVWGYLWSSDKEVVGLVATVMPLAVMFQISDGLGAVGSGILRGCGRQKVGAALNLTGYYILGLPLGALFIFVLKLGILGIWLGLTMGLVFVSLSQIFIITCRTDWKAEALKALKLVQVHADQNQDESDELSNNTQGEV